MRGILRIIKEHGLSCPCGPEDETDWKVRSPLKEHGLSCPCGSEDETDWKVRSPLKGHGLSCPCDSKEGNELESAFLHL